MELYKNDSKVRWTDQLERILISWADKAIVYKWFHTQASKKYKKLNYSFTIPCVILSSILASASFSITGQGGLIPDQYKDIAQYCIGGINIFIGVLQTLQNFFKFAQNSESHEGVSKQWFKFYRMINTELNLERNKRKDADDFLKYCRLEFDRLIELSPNIPKEIINEFRLKFKNVKNLELPDICDVIEHTTSYKHNDIEDKQPITFSNGILNNNNITDNDIGNIIYRLNLDTKRGLIVEDDSSLPNVPSLINGNTIFDII